MLACGVGALLMSWSGGWMDGRGYILPVTTRRVLESGAVMVVEWRGECSSLDATVAAVVAGSIMKPFSEDLMCLARASRR
jgi:hypothetical protein